MLTPPMIIGNGRIDLAAANSVKAQPAYGYQIRTDGLKFIDLNTQAVIDAFELVEDILDGQPFILANTSHAQLNIFPSSLNTSFSTQLQHVAGEVRLSITHSAPFGPHGDSVFKDLDITFTESKQGSDTSLSVAGQVTLNFFNYMLVLDANFDPDLGLNFSYNNQNNPSQLVFNGIGTMALDTLTIEQSSVEAANSQFDFAPSIEVKGQLHLDPDFAVVPNQTFGITFNYNPLERTMVSDLKISMPITSQLTFNCLELELSRPPGQATWQLTGQGQVNLTLFNQSLDFFTPAPTEL